MFITITTTTTTTTIIIIVVVFDVDIDVIIITNIMITNIAITKGTTMAIITTNATSKPPFSQSLTLLHHCHYRRYGDHHRTSIMKFSITVIIAFCITTTITIINTDIIAITVTTTLQLRSLQPALPSP